VLVPGLSDSSEVPPTLVTHGWLAGSWMLGMVVPSPRMHPNAPVSWLSSNMLCPCIAICSNTTFSDWT
jgi:hypothetical protein